MVERIVQCETEAEAKLLSALDTATAEISRLAAEVAGLRQKLEAAERALRLAVNMIMAYEPPDSRAVSSEAVALAAVVAKCDDQACWDVIDRGLSGQTEKQGGEADG